MTLKHSLLRNIQDLINFKQKQVRCNRELLSSYEDYIHIHCVTAILDLNEIHKINLMCKVEEILK